MNGIKNMLLGIAIIGLIFVIKGYNTKDTDNESTE